MIHLTKKHWDSFAIDDYFQLTNHRKIPTGIIRISAKYIPFGYRNSLFDKNGLRKKLEELVENGNEDEQSYMNLTESENILSNEASKKEAKEDDSLNSSKSEEFDDKQKQKLSKNSLSLSGSSDSASKSASVKPQKNKGNKGKSLGKNEGNFSGEKKKKSEEKDEEVNSSYSKEFDKIPENDFENSQSISKVSKFSEEDHSKSNKNNVTMTILKEIDLEITNIMDKELLRSDDFYFKITSEDEEGNEMDNYSSEHQNFISFLDSLPFTCHFSLYSDNKKEQLKFWVKLMNKSEQGTFASCEIEFSNKEKYTTIQDRFILQGMNDRNYTFFLKINIETVKQ